jgi:uncharacterized protein (DUF1684 family)
MSPVAITMVALMSSTPPAWTAAAPTSTAQPSAEADWKAWREKRLSRLRREDGWLALAGLHWLAEGENRIEGLPGRFILRGGKVRLEAEAADGWTLDGAAATSRELAPDTAEKPDRLRNGSRQLQVIERSGKLALRAWDAESPVRKSFQGIDTFPYDPRWRIEATFEAFPAPKEVETPSVLGTPQKELSPGRVRFSVGGRELTLEPTQEKPGEDLFFVFKDETWRKETYGAGRFLYTPPPADGKVVLDFNRAYNPPCVFTPYATCPLPRRENVLPVRVEAGEKRWGEH